VRESAARVRQIEDSAISNSVTEVVVTNVSIEVVIVSLVVEESSSDWNADWTTVWVEFARSGDEGVADAFVASETVESGLEHFTNGQFDSFGGCHERKRVSILQDEFRFCIPWCCE